MSKRRSRRKLTPAEEDAMANDLPGRARGWATELREHHDLLGLARRQAMELIKHYPTATEPIVLTDLWWKLEFVLTEFLRQNPPRPIMPRRIARLVDKEVFVEDVKPTYLLDEGRLTELWLGRYVESVSAARKKIALSLGKSLTAVKAAHLKYGQHKGVRGRPKKS